MLDEEARAIAEVAKTIGKATDLVKSAGGFPEDIFGETFRQLGGTVADWARYLRYNTLLLISNKQPISSKNDALPESQFLFRRTLSFRY